MVEYQKADRISGLFRAPVLRPVAGLSLRWKLALLAVLLILILGLLVWAIRPGGQPRGGRYAGNAPMAVGTATATKGDLNVTLNALGTVTPLATVTVVTQIAGQLQQVYFQEGQTVRKGDPLALVDPRPYENALEQAQGQLAHDKALLANAEKDLKRYDTLVKQDSIAAQTRDTQAALVEQYKSTLITDQAAIDTAKLNIAYCHITSPVTGRVGLRQVDPGNYVTPTSTSNGLVVVTELQPISVIFVLPEDDLPAIQKQLHANQTLAVTAYDRSWNKLADGKLETIDNQIDTTTGTFKLRAIFDNPDELLFPNQFVNTVLLVTTLHDQTIVPTTAVQRGAPGTFVYVVNPADDTVSVRPVKLGPTENDKVAIDSGLQPGDVVVTDGTDRLKDGAKVMLPGSQPAAGQGQQRHHKRSSGETGQSQGQQGQGQ
ncbi:MAG TPA: efflux RND transporter periplasmic adaptor subunit [Alphaproteobacteria bacterium]|nr:efflux RND transporter periplasmic adaptor subunit [Alphaproteobacteria bacterium]